MQRVLLDIRNEDGDIVSTYHIGFFRQHGSAKVSDQGLTFSPVLTSMHMYFRNTSAISAMPCLHPHQRSATGANTTLACLLNRLLPDVYAVTTACQSTHQIQALPVLRVRNKVRKYQRPIARFLQVLLMTIGLHKLQAFACIIKGNTGWPRLPCCSLQTTFN